MIMTTESCATVILFPALVTLSFLLPILPNHLVLIDQKLAQMLHFVDQNNK